MTNFESDNGASREDLVQRIALMETMIAEGRSATGRFGWIFVLWGLVDLTGMAWQWFQPSSHLVWPVTIGVGFVIQAVGLKLRRRAGVAPDTKSLQSRSIEAVWSMMGFGISLYCAAAIVRDVTWQSSYIAAVLMLVGLAHAVSAKILRWRAQGVVAAFWWAGALASYFLPGGLLYLLIVAEMLFGLVGFGLYAMMLERRRESGLVREHA